MFYCTKLESFSVLPANLFAFYLLPFKLLSAPDLVTYHPTPPPILAKSALLLAKCLNR